MNSYSQNKEDLKVLRYFKGRKGTLLSVGENNGIMLSNAKLLIEQGFSAYLLEPSTVFPELEKLHKGNKKVTCFNIGLGNKTQLVKFFESKNHIPGGDDKSLVSSVNYEETQRWRDSGVEFVEGVVQITTFKEFWESQGSPKFNFISIDTEGFDWDILQQINLKETGTEILCIEWNGDKDLESKFTSYCKKFGLKEMNRNAENLIYSI